MVVRLKNPMEAEKIFNNWPEALIWSCLQNIMGAVYAEAEKNPRSAMAILGDFCYLAGTPDRELLQFKPIECKQDFMILIPQNPTWADLIRRHYGERAKAVTRYAIKKEGDHFDRDKLQHAVLSLEPGYEMRMIDKDCFKLCNSENWSHDLVSQFSDYEQYKKLGIGAVILKDGALISGASSYARYRDGIEIEIDTKKEFRRKGLAYACGARLILECLKRGLYPSWDAQNPGSVELAKKLGYHPDQEYPAYEIEGYGK